MHMCHVFEFHVSVSGFIYNLYEFIFTLKSILKLDIAKNKNEYNWTVGSNFLLPFDVLYTFSVKYVKIVFITICLLLSILSTYRPFTFQPVTHCRILLCVHLQILVLDDQICI